LYGGGRASKAEGRIEAYGTVDELNAALAVARAESPPEAIDALLADVQNDLFVVGAELATRDPAARAKTVVVDARHIGQLESAIDRFEAQLAPLTAFILPGGTSAAAALHLARTICRRAERRVVSLAETAGEEVSADVVVYLNRLGDLLFVLARAANKSASVDEPLWDKDRTPTA
jgi:cob(I)alamin adenosyltransferase